MLMCNIILQGICLSTFSHDAVRILASPESITGGTPNYKMEEFEAKPEFLGPNTSFEFETSMWDAG